MINGLAPLMLLNSSLFTLRSSLNIVESRSVPSRLLRLDGDDAWFDVVYILQVFFQGERDNSHVDFLVDTLGGQAVLEHHVGLVPQFGCHLYRLFARPI